MTVVFCDVTGSTELGESLDPEALRALLARYFERMNTIVERHGGTVEKFIGDAVMAVFGVPVLHEDDALRALRAAVEMREAFPELGIQGRDRRDHRRGRDRHRGAARATRRRRQRRCSARSRRREPGEILIGRETYRLTRDAVEVEALEPLSAEGQGRAGSRRIVCSPFRARRASRRHAVAPMVGRGREQRHARERVGACDVRAVVSAVHDSRAGRRGQVAPRGRVPRGLARWTRSSCAAAVSPTGRASPTGRSSRWSGSCPPAEPDPVARETIDAPCLAISSASPPARRSPGPFASTWRRLPSERPLVCVFDDLHWGEETFLDLVEHVADLSRDAPILLLCMARPDLLDRRTGWGGRQSQRDHGAARASCTRGDGAPDREPGGLWTGPCAPASGRLPKATRSSSRRWLRSSRSPATGEVTVPPDDPGAAGRSPRPARTA